MPEIIIPLAGPSAKTGAALIQAGRTLNFLIEASGDADVPYYLRHSHGYFRWADLSSVLAIPEDAPVRGAHVAGTRAFCVIRQYILEIIDNNSFVVKATLSTFVGRVGISDNSGKLIFGDGTGFFVLDLTDNSLTPVLNDDSEPILGYISRWIDGTTLYFHRDSDRYSYSEINDPTTVRGLSFFSAEGNPDKIVNAWVVNREIIILGEKSTEWHWDSGDADNPFQRMSGGFTEHGCAGRWASCKFDNTVVMVGNDEDGGGIIWRLRGAGSPPEKISEPALEERLRKVIFSNENLPPRITMFGFQDAGHVLFYVNLPEVEASTNSPEQPSCTWVFDGSVPRELAWTERAYKNPETGQYERILSDHHFFWRGRHYTGGYNRPHIYEQFLDGYRENTIELVKERTIGPIRARGGGSLRVLSAELIGQTGVGRGGGVQGSNPKVMFHATWDGVPQPVVIERDWGRMGQTKCRAKTGPLGRGRALTLKIACSEPIAFDVSHLVLNVA